MVIKDFYKGPQLYKERVPHQLPLNEALLLHRALIIRRSSIGAGLTHIYGGL